MKLGKLKNGDCSTKPTSSLVKNLNNVVIYTSTKGEVLVWRERKNVNEF